MKTVTIELEEEERQAMLLALAVLSLQRPGWDDMLNRIALRMDNFTKAGRGEMYDSFRELQDSERQLAEARVTAAAAAIANARGGRHGMPPISNVLNMLPQTLVDEVMEDAKAALEAIP